MVFAIKGNVKEIKLQLKIINKLIRNKWNTIYKLIIICIQ